jgi:hypothetical protein
MNTMRDFKRHNEEVRQVWESYEAGRPVRVPVGRFTIGPRIWLLDPALNVEGITWRAFANDPELMFQVLLKYEYHLRHHVVHDIEMGIPESHWDVFTEFVNITEGAWWGCEVLYPGGQVPAIHPRYEAERRNELFDRGIPDPFSGILGQVREYYEYFVERAKHCDFHGRPVRVLPPCPLGTDGPFTVAHEICGNQILADMYTDPDYFHRVMELVTEGTIAKIRAWRTYLNLDAKPERGGFADDMIQLISTDAYVEHVLPYHKRFIEALYGSGPHGMHLCGNVQRHLPTIVRELSVKSFDTGFPINFATLRDEVGEDVEINGGVRVDVLLNGTPERVSARTAEVLHSGILRGGRFVMKEANNMPPRTPLENIEAMYETVRRLGGYAVEGAARP